MDWHAPGAPGTAAEEGVAAIWCEVLRVPAVFVLQRNHYAYSTPTGREMVNTRLAERVYGGWSIPCETVDGTEVLVAEGPHDDALPDVGASRPKSSVMR